MNSATWQVDVDGTPHEVRLDWTYWGGERSVYVDGQLADEDKKLLRWKSDQPIVVGGKDAKVITRPHSAAHSSRFTIVLEIDGIEREPDNNSSDIGQR